MKSQSDSDSEEGSESGSDGDDDHDHGEEEEDDDDDHQHSDSGEEDSDSASEHGSDSATLRSPDTQVVSNVDSGNISGQHHAEHVEDVSQTASEAAEEQTQGTEGEQHATDDLPIFPLTLFLVSNVVKDSSGSLQDLRLTPLAYTVKPDATIFSFQLYGNQFVANVPTAYASKKDSMTSLNSDKLSTSILDLPTLRYLLFAIPPDADYIRRTQFRGRCPANCHSGWLSSITQLHGMVKDYTVPSALPNEPAVCPACIGIDLMKAHQDLRAELETFSHIADMGRIVEFYFNLAPRRAELGYEFNQFDERQWGFLFDDMLSDDEDDGGAHDGQYEQWDEALDPNNGARLRPATDATIKALPVVAYADVKKEEDVRCVVCCEEFKDEQYIVLLPCKHFLCVGECTEHWLKQVDNCPICRARLPAPERSQASDGDDEDEDEQADEASVHEEAGEGATIDQDGDTAMAGVVYST